MTAGGVVHSFDGDDDELQASIDNIISGMICGVICGMICGLLGDSTSNAINDNQWRSVAIGSSVVISGHQWPSVVISGHPWPSVAISGHQWPSVVISDHQ